MAMYIRYMNTYTGFGDKHRTADALEINVLLQVILKRGLDEKKRFFQFKLVCECRLVSAIFQQVGWGKSRHNFAGVKCRRLQTAGGGSEVSFAMTGGERRCAGNNCREEGCGGKLHDSSWLWKNKKVSALEQISGMMTKCDAREVIPTFVAAKAKMKMSDERCVFSFFVRRARRARAQKRYLFGL